MFTKEEIKQAIQAERHHELIANSCTHLPGGEIMLTEEFDSVRYLERLMKTAKQLRSTSEAATIPVRGRGGRQITRLTRLGQDLLLACKLHHESLYAGVGPDEHLRYQHYKFHPYLEVMLEVVPVFKLEINQAATDKDHALLCQAISRLATAARTVFKSQKFKTDLRNYERNSEIKLHRALRYLLSLFRQRSRLLILRVDLYVREEAKAWSYSVEADEAFDKFATALSAGGIVEDVIGWMSAREDGVDRGRHFHVLAAVDGHLHHAGANLTKMLGEYWVKECVGSDKVGSYFNCFKLVNRYKFLGIGMVHCMDAKKLLGLYYATRYLCKDDVQLIATGERVRNFRRGKEDKNYVRPGAPRRHDDDLSLARQVLFGQMRTIKARLKKALLRASQSAPTDQCSFPP